jgi:hypothetical protein
VASGLFQIGKSVSAPGVPTKRLDAHPGSFAQRVRTWLKTKEMFFALGKSRKEGAENPGWKIAHISNPDGYQKKGLEARQNGSLSKQRG